MRRCGAMFARGENLLGRVCDTQNGKKFKLRFVSTKKMPPAAITEWLNNIQRAMKVQVRMKMLHLQPCSLL
jgi:hypothetical protein